MSFFFKPQVPKVSFSYLWRPGCFFADGETCLDFSYDHDVSLTFLDDFNLSKIFRFH